MSIANRRKTVDDRRQRIATLKSSIKNRQVKNRPIPDWKSDVYSDINRQVQNRLIADWKISMYEDINKTLNKPLELKGKVLKWNSLFEGFERKYGKNTEIAELRKQLNFIHKRKQELDSKK